MMEMMMMMMMMLVMFLVAVADGTPHVCYSICIIELCVFLYTGGIFQVDIVIPPDYPFNPPKMKFITKST